MRPSVIPTEDGSHQLNMFKISIWLETELIWTSSETESRFQSAGSGNEGTTLGTATNSYMKNPWFG